MGKELLRFDEVENEKGEFHLSKREICIHHVNTDKGSVWVLK